jgi:hypothetical protein
LFGGKTSRRCEGKRKPGGQARASAETYRQVLIDVLARDYDLMMQSYGAATLTMDQPRIERIALGDLESRDQGPGRFRDNFHAAQETPCHRQSPARGSEIDL